MINKITTFKARWEIKKNWQFLFPIIGVIFLGYSSFKLVKLIPVDWFDLAEYYFVPYSMFVLYSVGIFYFLLKTILFAINKLESKWIVNQRWELIRIFIVFTLTGSSSVYVGRPFINLVGISTENLNPFIYWLLYIVISLIFYQILLVFWGWLLGQFDFFWAFEKKMLSRLGFKCFQK